MDRRMFIKTVAFGGASLALVGCGGSGSSDAGSSSGSALTTAVVATDGYTLVTEGTLTAGISADYKPFEYIENGEFKGYEIDLLYAIADKMDLELQLENVDYDTILPGVSTGTKYDIGMAAITVTPEREKEVDFTESYYLDGQVFCTMNADLGLTEDNYKEEVNQSSFRIAVQSGSTSESIAQEDFPQATIVPFQSGTDCFAAIQAGQADGTVTGRLVAAEMMEAYPDLIVIANIPTGEENAIAVSKDNPGLTEALSEVIIELTEDGTIEQLQQKYSLGA